MSNYNDYIHEKYDSDYNGILHNYPDIYTLRVSSNNMQINSRPSYLIDNMVNERYRDWCSESRLYEYVQIDFKKTYTLTPTSYTFVARNITERYAYNPMNWTVQGLFRDEWKNISEVRNSSLDLIRSRTFTIDKLSEYLNSIRFMQISTNSQGPDSEAPNVFCLVELEIFGIIKKGICYFSQNCVYFPKQILSFLTMIIIVL